MNVLLTFLCLFLITIFVLLEKMISSILRSRKDGRWHVKCFKKDIEKRIWAAEV